MRVLIQVLNLAGNWVVYILGVVEPDVRDAFWDE